MHRRGSSLQIRRHPAPLISPAYLLLLSLLLLVGPSTRYSGGINDVPRRRGADSAAATTMVAASGPSLSLALAANVVDQQQQQQQAVSDDLSHNGISVVDKSTTVIVTDTKYFMNFTSKNVITIHVDLYQARVPHIEL